MSNILPPRIGFEKRFKRTRKSTEKWFVDSLLEAITGFIFVEFLKRRQAAAVTQIEYTRST